MTCNKFHTRYTVDGMQWHLCYFKSSLKPYNSFVLSDLNTTNSSITCARFNSLKSRLHFQIRLREITSRVYWINVSLVCRQFVANRHLKSLNQLFTDRFRNINKKYSTLYLCHNKATDLRYTNVAIFALDDENIYKSREFLATAILATKRVIWTKTNVCKELLDSDFQVQRSLTINYSLDMLS